MSDENIALRFDTAAKADAIRAETAEKFRTHQTEVKVYSQDGATIEIPVQVAQKPRYSKDGFSI